MPFTLSHTAASLPFLNRSKAVGWRSALVFGTMAPDLMFPIPYFGERNHTHSFKGLFALDVPLAVVLSILWVFVLSKRLSRLPGLETLGAQSPSSFSIFAAFIGATVGASTHLLWDLFTHQGSPLLGTSYFSQPLFPGANGAVTPQTVVWYFNSFVGMVILALWVRRRFHQQGKGVRKSFLAPSWIRIYIAFLFPYCLILTKACKGRVDLLSQWIANLAQMVDLVRMGMLLSFVVALAMAWWETRDRASFPKISFHSGD